MTVLILDSNNPYNSFTNKSWSLSCFCFSFQPQLHLLLPLINQSTSRHFLFPILSLLLLAIYSVPVSCLKHLFTNYSKMQLEHLANILNINIFNTLTGHKVYLDWSQVLRRNHFSSPFHLYLETTYLRGLEINL